MCEPTDWLRQLKEIGLDLSMAVDVVTKPGTGERRALRRIVESVKADLNTASEQWQSERDRDRSVKASV